MAIAHICMQCGLDLSRQRVHIDPHYRLPLVICSRCSAAWVRRRHPIQQRWRQFIRAATAVCVIALHVFMFALLLLFNVWTLGVIAQAWRTGSVQDWINNDGHIAVAILTMAHVLIGAWMAAALSHLCLWKVWFGWIALVGLIAICGMTADTLTHRPHGMPVVSLVILMLEDWGSLMLGLTALMTVTAAGIPLGGLLRRAYAHHRKFRWRKRRARFRRIRTAA